MGKLVPHRLDDRLTLAALALALWLPLLGLAFSWQADVVLHENREPAPRPGLPASVADVRTWAPRFERWFDDHLGFRNVLIRWNNAVSVLWLRVNPRTHVGPDAAPLDVTRGADPFTSRAVVGRDSWIYYFGPGMMADFRGVDPLPPETVAAWRRTLDAHRDTAAALGARYLFVLVPEKQYVHPEHLPGTLRRVSPVTRSDQLATALADSDVPFLDLRPLLRAAARDGPVYERTGTHWNALGAHLAYTAIAERIARDFPAVRAAPLDAYEIETRRGPSRTLLVQMLGIEDLLQEDYVVLRPRALRRATRSSDGDEAPIAERVFGQGQARLVTETGDARLPRAVIFHDSFMRYELEPLLSECFARAVYRWQPGFDPELIAAEHPDLVIEERAERFLVEQTPTG